LELKEKGLNF